MPLHVSGQTAGALPGCRASLPPVPTPPLWPHPEGLPPHNTAVAQCSAAFVTKTLAPLLPPKGRPYETFWSIIQFRFVAWGALLF